jgi:hypothetical protein
MGKNKSKKNNTKLKKKYQKALLKLLNQQSEPNQVPETKH